MSKEVQMHCVRLLAMAVVRQTHKDAVSKSLRLDPGDKDAAKNWIGTDDYCDYLKFAQGVEI